MKEELFPPDDNFHIRCPRLGHQINFSYCRTENQGLPCFKTLDCWHTHFDAAQWLRKELTPDEWQKVFVSPPKSKLISLVELIEQAKQRAKQKA